jgi:signal peptidase II
VQFGVESHGHRFFASLRMTTADHPPSVNRARAVHLLLAVLVVLADRWTKHLVAARIVMYNHIQIIPGFFRITHTENTGAAFSLFADSRSHWKTSALIAFSVVALVIVVGLLWKQKQPLTTTGIALSLILGGAFGNLWDRVASGRVVDFLLFYIGQHQWPVFNLADSSIVIGACLLVVEILFVHPQSAEAH